MLHLFGILFFVALAVLVIGLVIVSRIAKGIFNVGRKMTGKDFTGNRREDFRQENTRSSGTETRTHSPRKKKVFDDDEGEYVDFEEIKD